MSGWCAIFQLANEEDLSFILTIDYVQFKKIVTEAMQDSYDNDQDPVVYAESKWKLYGQDFLNACIEQKTSK
jgi:hypothetical protein